ncbi:MAG: DMT family transporter [Eubacteriales bacterium]|nr:DMT family transporter [Eubacteriales bacterium]
MEEQRQTGGHALQGHALAAFTELVWGTTFVATKVLLRTFTPLEIMIARFALGFLALLLAGRGLLRVQKWSHEGLLALAGLTGVTLYFLMENIALTYISASLVGVIVAAAPLFTALVAALVLRERLSRWFFLGFVCAMTGVAMASLAGVRTLHLDLRGVLLGVGAALVWGIYSVTVRRLGELGYQTVPLTCRIFGYGLLFLLPPALYEGFPAPAAAWTEPRLLAGLLFLGLLASATCFVTWNRAVQILGPVRTSVYIYATPIITIVSSALVLHETMTPAMWVGTALTLVGLVLSERRA